MMTAIFAATLLLPLARKLLHRDTEFIRVHAVDYLLCFSIKLLLGWGDRGLVDQRLGVADRGRRILRQSVGGFLRRRLQFCPRNTLGDQTPITPLLRGEGVLRKKYLHARRTPTVPTMPTVLPPSGDTPIL